MQMVVVPTAGIRARGAHRGDLLTPLDRLAGAHVKGVEVPVGRVDVIAGVIGAVMDGDKPAAIGRGVHQQHPARRRRQNGRSPRQVDIDPRMGPIAQLAVGVRRGPPLGLDGRAAFGHVARHDLLERHGVRRGFDVFRASADQQEDRNADARGQCGFSDWTILHAKDLSGATARSVLG